MGCQALDEVILGIMLIDTLFAKIIKEPVRECHLAVYTYLPKLFEILKIMIVTEHHRKNNGKSDDNLTAIPTMHVTY